MEDDLLGSEIQQQPMPTSTPPQPVQPAGQELPAVVSDQNADTPPAEIFQQTPTAAEPAPVLSAVMTPMSQKSESTRVPQQGFYENLTHSDFLQNWRTSEQARVDELAEKESQAKQKVLAKAQADLNAFYAEQTILKQKSKERNRKLEADFISVRDSKTSQGWEGVVGMIELGQKGAPAVKDMARMRGMLLELKNA